MRRPSWKIIKSHKERASFFMLKLGLVGLSLSSFGLFADTTRDDLPQALHQLQDRMEALRASAEKDTMGVILHATDEAFTLAEKNLQEHEYIAVIRNLNFVLNQTPSLPQSRYLRAQYMLGSSYEALKQPTRAGKAWLRYLSSYSTQQGDDSLRLIEVIRRALLVEEQLAEVHRSQLQRLLADITALQLAPEVRAEIHLMAAIAAIHRGQHRLAKTWLEKVRAIQPTGRLGAEAAFYTGLSAMQQGKDKEAESVWLQIAELQDESSTLLRDLAALNLGRLYAARKMPRNAMEWYKKVKVPGTTSRLAAYEMTLFLAQSGQYAEASQSTQSFITHYPAARETYELKEKLPFLLYKAGYLDLSETQVKERDKSLAELREWLEATTRGRLALIGSDLKEVDDHIQAYAIRSPTIDRSRQLFAKLESQAQILQDQRNELRSMMLTLGRVVDPDLRPRIIQNNRQLNLLLDEWAQFGEKLIGGEKDLYQDQLSASEQLTLDRSQTRRTRLQGLAKEWRRRGTDSWQELTQVSLRLGEMARRLEKQQATLGSILLKAQSSNNSKIQELGILAKDFSNRLASLQVRTDQLVEQHRKNLLAQQLRDSPYQLTRKRLLLNAQEFLDAEAIFSRHRDQFNHPMRKHAQEDYQLSWDGFRGIAGQALSYIRTQEEREKSWLQSQIQTFDRLNQKLSDLRARQLELERRLATLTGKAWPQVMDHLSYHINEQQAHAKKWLADLQWQRSIDQAQKRAQRSDEQERKETDLQENLKDLELEGALHE